MDLHNQFRLVLLQDDYNGVLEKCKEEVKEYMEGKQKKPKDEVVDKDGYTILHCECGSNSFSIRKKGSDFRFACHQCYKEE